MENIPANAPKVGKGGKMTKEYLINFLRNLVEESKESAIEYGTKQEYMADVQLGIIDSNCKRLINKIKLEGIEG